MSGDKNNVSAEDEALERALLAVVGARGGAEREKAVTALHRLAGRRVQRYFERRRIPSETAEEMVSDLWLKVLHGGYSGAGRAVVWMWTMAHHQVVDHQRRQKPEVQLDDDGWAAVADGLPARSVPAWVRTCIERALHVFEGEQPERVEVLCMIAEGWSADEIGAYFGSSAAAARDRVHRARKAARELFAHCKEDE